MNSHHLIFIICSLIITISACDHGGTNTTTKNITTVSPDSVMKMNIELVRQENQEIDDFCFRYGWKMNKSTTGLRYLMIKSGNSKSKVKGSTVQIRYEVRLLTGDLIDKTTKDSVSTIILGKASVTSGLEEGLLMMNYGDHYKFIVPSNLAFGLMGDMKKVPQRASLVYDVELLKISSTHK